MSKNLLLLFKKIAYNYTEKDDAFNIFTYDKLGDVFMVETNDNKKIIQTDENAKNGQHKCSKCGSTDISLDTSKGVLVCNFCRNEFEIEKVEGLVDDITNLKGEIEYQYLYY